MVAAAAKSRSMMSRTSDDVGVTATTRPTSIAEPGNPAATGWSTSMPSPEPLSIVTVYSKFDTPLAMTLAVTAVGKRVCRRPAKATRSSYCAFTNESAATCERNASFSLCNRSLSSASEGRCASPEKKSPMGSVTVVTTRCSGAMNAFAALPRPARGPESPWR